MSIFVKRSQNFFRSPIYTQLRTKKSKKTKPSVPTILIEVKEVRRFIVDCMLAAGASKDNACALATVLLAADRRGYFSHGVNRLENYVRDVQKCICDGKAIPKIENETPGTAWVNGNYGLGAVVGQFCMKLAMKKAKEVGVGWVAAYKSTHYGIASYYSVLALKKGLIGFSCSNTSPMVAPIGTKEAALGTNPISLAAPARDCDSIILDMAITHAARGKIEVAAREKKKIPDYWVQDEHGKPITDPNVALARGVLRPIGGPKGTGLALMVEVFCGILAGGNYGPKIPLWGKTEKKSNICHSFVALNPECFAPCFKDRLSDLLTIIRKMEPVDYENPVMVPGDPERVHTMMVADKGGIEYIKEELKWLQRLAEELGVEPLKPKC